MGIKNAGFDADVESVEKTGKIVTEKSYKFLPTVLKDEKQQNSFTFMLITFSVEITMQFFHQIQNQTLGIAQWANCCSKCSLCCAATVARKCSARATSSADGSLG
jgi:hypothetical protein